MQWKAAFLLVLILSGCAGTNFTWDDAYKVQPGMTEAEVIKILGQPYQKLLKGNQTLLTWSFANGMTGKTKAVSFVLVDGKVTEGIPPGME